MNKTIKEASMEEEEIKADRSESLHAEKKQDFIQIKIE